MLYQPNHVPQPSRASALPQKTRSCCCCCGSDLGRDALPTQPRATAIARKRAPTENQGLPLLLWERPWSRCSISPITCPSHRAQARFHRKPGTAVAVVGATLVAMLCQPNHVPQPSRASALPQKTRDCRCCCGSDLGRDALPTQPRATAIARKRAPTTACREPHPIGELADATDPQVAIHQLLAPHEHDPAGDGQVRAERDGGAVVLLLQPQPEGADDRADQ